MIAARVIGIANSEVRADMARENGAHATFLYSDPDLRQKISDFTDGDGVDLVILTANPFPAHKTQVHKQPPLCLWLVVLF